MYFRLNLHVSRGYILRICILLIKLANVVPVASAAGYKTRVVFQLIIAQLDDSLHCYSDPPERREI